MVLPVILSLLGSGLAGAGAIGLSPLLAGSIGAGLGSAIETGDLGEGIKTGLLSGLLGGIGGSLFGGGANTALNEGTKAALNSTAGQGAIASGTGAAAQGGLGNLLKLSGSGMSPVTTGPLAGQGFKGMGLFGGDVPFKDVAQAGLRGGVMTGAGLGTAMGGLAMSNPYGSDMGGSEKRDIPQAAPADRGMMRPTREYRPGFDPEFSYFNPSVIGARGFARGGVVEREVPGVGSFNMSPGGLADIAAPAPQMPNEKDVIRGAITAIKGGLSEQEAAMALAMFLQTFGEQALRRLVDDVQTGRVDGSQGDVEGKVSGAGDGMSDTVPAATEDGEDVLLSDGEFVVPADVVSGIGNGSTDAGAAELDNMMARVRQSRTGTPQQPARMNMGGLLPA